MPLLVDKLVTKWLVDKRNVLNECLLKYVESIGQTLNILKQQAPPVTAMFLSLGIGSFGALSSVSGTRNLTDATLTAL